METDTLEALVKSVSDSVFCSKTLLTNCIILLFLLNCVYTDVHSFLMGPMFDPFYTLSSIPFCTLVCLLLLFLFFEIISKTVRHAGKVVN